MAQTWKRYHQYWVDLAKNKSLPIYFLRFEDIMKDKKKYLCEAYSFLLGVEDISGTYLEKRIEAEVEA